MAAAPFFTPASFDAGFGYTFKRGEMKDADIEKVIGDLPKLVK
jgi:hypothetical protein